MSKLTKRVVVMLFVAVIAALFIIAICLTPEITIAGKLAAIGGVLCGVLIVGALVFIDY